MAAKRILHQADVQSVIDASIDANNEDHLTTTPIASPDAPSAAYDQTEAASMKTAVDAILAALVTAGIVAEA